ncbi:hypothetical protein L210DRAFT_714606 [Boletus edulis BED1]|uniref:Uncharacterized protein n=1 Tax=Boletus edulis BED1 TaxID=1328754 RepID=A0AAD4GLR8_BOLED|nr:hypothetical protein L210DRAFT_714606 [Boletus edulis BED1]
MHLLHVLSAIFDRPSTLIQLAAVHFAQFEKGRDEIALYELRHCCRKYQSSVLQKVTKNELRAATTRGPCSGGWRIIQGAGSSFTHHGNGPVDLKCPVI